MDHKKKTYEHKINIIWSYNSYNQEARVATGQVGMLKFHGTTPW